MKQQNKDTPKSGWKLVRSWLVTIGATLILAEGLVWLFVRSDSDGNSTIGQLRLLPYEVPLARTADLIKEYRKKKAAARLLYDPDLGWAPQPSFCDPDTFYCYDQNGARSRDTTRVVGTDLDFTILIFGDSFAHGDEVRYEHSWAALLDGLVIRGRRIATINYGVSGFGFGQAYLRFFQVIQDHDPDWVILGLPLENMERNLNVFRPLANPATRIPFSKPRFYLQNDTLLVHNVPCISATEMLKKMANDGIVRRFEGAMTNYRSDFWDNAYLVRLGRSVHWHFAHRDDLYQPESEGFRITLHILQQLNSTCRESGIGFSFVELPTRFDLRYDKWLATPPYAALADTIHHKIDYIRTIHEFRLEDQTIDAYFMQTHYNRTGNQRIANAIINHLEAQLQ
jgi:hypothetical protein